MSAAPKSRLAQHMEPSSPMKLHRAPHEAIVVQSKGPVYQGQAGQTRTERVHLVEVDGSVRSVEVHRVVNVATHPDLKPRLLAGQLHRLEDGRELALPFVYHDPNARKFALVIPPALAHLEMKEWARLMTEVAEDTSHPIPPYVRDGMTVLGLGALELFLEAGVEPDDDELRELPESQRPRPIDLQVREQGLSERERMLRDRERESAEQEQALIRMAKDLASQEAALQRREQQLQTARADLDAREAELKDQKARVRAAAHEADVVPDGEWQEVRASEPDAMAARDPATVVTSMSGVLAQAPLDVQDSELEDVLARPGRGAPPPLRRRSSGSMAAPDVRQVPPPLRGRGSDPAPPAAGAGSTRGTIPPPLPRAERASRMRGRSDAPPPLRRSSSAPTPQLDTPAGFAALPPLGMLLASDKSELTFFVRLDPARPDVFDEEAELLVQFAEPDGYPVVVFTLLGAGRAVSRTAIDGLSADTRAVLERLERVFRATVALFAGNELRATRAILAPREANARAILERLARPRPAPVLHAAQALELALREPPPLPDESLPFGPPRPQPASTASVFAAVQRLEQWVQPDKLELALVGYSIPKHVIDASCRRVLRAAIGFGIALPPRLVDLAVEQKLADGRAQLVREQLEAFRQRIERQQNDLDAAAAMQNWARLFAQADQLDLEIPRDLRQWVERSARASGAPPPDLPLSSAELRRDLGDPGRRLDAIRELARRGHPSAIPPIIDVLEELAPEEVASAVVTLLGFGERAADGLMFALAAPSQHVRHACALGLGQLKLARSVPILIRQIEAEPTPSWSEMARALGDFGKVALSGVADALKASERRERLMLGLAHLANHGCAKEVKSLESHPDPGVALAARQALVRRARMEVEDDAVRTQQPLRDNSPEARFSQAFFAEIARVAS
jgi:hypothetical protein